MWEELFFYALHKESTQSSSNVTKGCDVCLTPFTAVRILASPTRTHVVCFRSCRCCWLCAWLENRFDRRDSWLLSHLVRAEDLIFGNKIPISWTAAKCQRCLLSSESPPWLSVIGWHLYIRANIYAFCLCHDKDVDTIRHFLSEIPLLCARVIWQYCLWGKFFTDLW